MKCLASIPLTTLAWSILLLIICINLYTQPEEFWFSAPKKGVMVFALPGEPGLTELVGDFKIHFHDRQGDFYWFVIVPLSAASVFLYAFIIWYLNFSILFIVLLFLISAG